ncbi:MAG: pyridoxal-dependent decarboxylase [Aquamicrobium sp.]|uniref:pyridoxal phosphate-dependent decarboxylase family protein n=1 Tax=Aquamicrobium sp. TaxID=1872579 RepID=UPI00349EBEA8|nr:pyridoxal-dependent decarboxylase [Aquamicrobium sp.]
MAISPASRTCAEACAKASLNRARRSTACSPLFADWVPRSFGTPGPGYLAYIPGGGVYPAALASFIADAVNRYTGIWQAAPALVQLEANTLECRYWTHFTLRTRAVHTRWIDGDVQCHAGAREQRLGTDIRAGTLRLIAIAPLHQQQGGASGGHRTIAWVIEVDAQKYRMRLMHSALPSTPTVLVGLKPFMVFSTAGTTNTGAVDPIDAVADLAAREGLWHHVDGAYGGFFHMVPELRHLLSGLSRADSLTLDPHKGLFLPYGTGALLVRDGEALRHLHSSSAGYLPANQSEFYDPAQYGPDLSRGFPGLRVWLTLKFFGAARYRAALAEKRALAVRAAEEISRIPGIVMDAWPDLSLFAFHLEGAALDTLEKQNAATRALMQNVTARGQIMMTGAQVGKRFLGRVCVLSFRTRMAQIQACVEQLRQEAACLLRSE